MAFSLFKKNRALVFKIESDSISLIEVKKSGPQFDVVNVLFEPLPTGIFDAQGNLSDTRNLWATVIKIFKQGKYIDEKQDTVNLGDIFGKFEIAAMLPERHVYNAKFNLTVNQGKKIDDEVLDFCALNFPITKDDIIFEYKLDDNSTTDKLKAPELNKKSGYVIATERKYIKFIRDLFLSGGIVINRFINDATANISLRYFDKNIKTDEKIALIDLSLNDMTLSFYNNGALIYSRTIIFGFKDIESKLLSQISSDSQSIRNFILSSGLSDINKKETHLLVVAIDVFISHIKETIEYMKKKRNFDCDDIVLTGYASVIPGMANYIGTNIEKKISTISVPFWKDGDSNNIAKLLYSPMLGSAFIMLSSHQSTATPIFDVEDNFREISANTIFGRLQYYAGINLSNDKKPKGLVEASAEINTKKSVEQIVAGDQKAIDVKSYKKLLIIVLVAGLGLIAMVFVVRLTITNFSPKKNLVSEVRQFAYTTNLDVELPVAIEATQFTPERVRGRTVLVRVSAEPNYFDTQKKALADASALLQSSEQIWETPIISAQANENPAKFTFAIFNKNEALSLSEVVIRSKLGSNDYQMGDTKYLDLISTDNPGVYLLKMVVAVYSSAIINGNQQQNNNDDSSPAIDTASASAKILDEHPLSESTATNSFNLKDESVDASFSNTPVKIARILGSGTSVNLRSSPNTKASIVTKLKDKEQVELVKSTNDWSLIVTKNGDEGWVLSELLIINLNN